MFKKAIFCALDVETTGLNCDIDEIIQFAGILLDENLEVMKEITLHAHPTLEKLDKEALEAFAINGYTPERWEKLGATDQAGLVKNLQKFFYGNGELLAIGHNISFDIVFITKAYENAGLEKDFKYLFQKQLLDTITIALFCDIVKYNKKGFSYKLTSLCKRRGIPLKGDAHDSRTDAQASLDLLHYLIKELREGNKNVT